MQAHPINARQREDESYRLHALVASGVLPSDVVARACERGNVTVVRRVDNVRRVDSERAAAAKVAEGDPANGLPRVHDGGLCRARSATQREAPRLVAWLRSRIPGFKHAAIRRYADTVYVRETRHFAGLERLTAGDVWAGIIPEDSIGLSSYPIDLHPVTLSDKPAFAPVRHVYGVPFGSLVPRGFDNLLIASPAISASHLASGSARIVPTTVEEGEAAGAAAALANKDHVGFATLAHDPTAIVILQADLQRCGVILAPAAIARMRTTNPA